ncbi:MAG: hypothetical protein WCO76_02450 [Planctomycetota bacterium]
MQRQADGEWRAAPNELIETFSEPSARLARRVALGFGGPILDNRHAWGGGDAFSRPLATGIGPGQPAH